jgi:hypothetical protein
MVASPAMALVVLDAGASVVVLAADAATDDTVVATVAVAPLCSPSRSIAKPTTIGTTTHPASTSTRTTIRLMFCIPSTIPLAAVKSHETKSHHRTKWVSLLQIPDRGSVIRTSATPPIIRQESPSASQCRKLSESSDRPHARSAPVPQGRVANGSGYRIDTCRASIRQVTYTHHRLLDRANPC